MLACTTGLRRWVPLINFDQGASVPLGLVFQLADELTPSHIADGFRKRVVLDHILDSQALHANHLAFVDDAGRKLVLVVSSAIIDPSMYSCDFETGLVSVPGPLLFLGKSSLGTGQLLLILSKIAGIANAFTSRECNHGFDAKIKTDHFVDHGLVFDLLFYQNGDKVAVRAILADCDRAGFDVLGEWSMPVDIQRSIHFCQRERLPIPLECIGGIGSRLIVLFLLESGILSTSLKEVHKGPIQVTKGLLQGNRRDIGKPGMLFLEIREHCSKIVVVQTLSILEVGGLTCLESPIVNKATASKRLSKDDSLLLNRIEPEFVCSLCLLAHLLAFLLLFYMLLKSVDDLSHTSQLAKPFHKINL